MKATLPLLSILALPLFATTVFTIPQGYTKITISAADNTGGSLTPTLTAISVSLLNDLDFSGTSTLGAYIPSTDSAAFTDSEGNNIGTQSLTVSGVTNWTADQWTNEPHLVYISVEDDLNNADGIAPAEEAFLIVANTVTGGLTIASDHDISSRFPVNAQLKIRNANTIDDILSNPSTPFDGNDRVNFWNGIGWESVRLIGTTWRNSINFSDASNMVVFPEEGLFIERSAATDTTITLFGEVPAAPQIATLTESGFLATRHPVATALPDLNIGNENWNDSNGDRVFVWNSAARSWTSYRFLGGTWRNASNFSDASALMIEGDTAVFVGRGLATTPENGAITPSLPFNPFAPSE